MAKEGTLLIENANVVFLNFEGREGKYNNAGERSFCVFLNEALAETMAADGWNIKTLKAREPGDSPRPYIQVAVNFKRKPPKIVMVTSKGRTTLTEDEVELIDWIDILKVDLIISPYDWAVSGNTGRKAYLKSFFVTIDEDYLDLKYSGVREIDRHGQPLAIESGSQQPYDFDGEVVED